MSSQLSKNILATIIYYDGLDYPLTAFEVWKYLIRMDYYNQDEISIEVPLVEVIKNLESQELFTYVRQLNGFYFLKDRQQLVKKRVNGSKISSGKIKKLRRIVWLLRFVPYVRMIGVTGRLAMKNATIKSDWDLLIATKQGKIWTGRTLVTVLVHILGKRRYAEKVSNRLCLNFFVTDESLEVMTKDLYSANEYMFMFPLFGWETYLRFQIKNHWIKGMKPHYGISELPPLKILSDSFCSKTIRKLGESVFGAAWIENLLRKVEKKRIMNNPKTHQEGSLVYANDDALVFLPNPHGPKIFDKFKEKVGQLSV
ncbi:MAG: hypothetical protein ACD_5C00003G0004 [uncultured bacterium]|nr:MAG: hypothetical protein ACD_5C00003G0004 [uncultured bacterium]